MDNANPSFSPSPALHIRWMIRRDMPEILTIEQLTARWEAQTEEDFLRDLGHRNVIGMVGEKNEKVISFMVYELNKHHFNILSLSVHPDWQRQGIGRLMVDKLKTKLSTYRRSYLQIIVPDTEVGAHLFLREMGFKAIKTLRNWTENTEDDAYLFEYRLPQVEIQEEFTENITENADI